MPGKQTVVWKAQGDEIKVEVWISMALDDKMSKSCFMLRCFHAQNGINIMEM